MYGYLYCENGGLEWLLDDVGFVQNLSLQCKKFAFFMFLKPYLRAHAHVAYAGRGFSLAFIFQKPIFRSLKIYIFHFNTSQVNL